jgi:hypothetical protein
MFSAPLLTATYLDTGCNVAPVIAVAANSVTAGRHLPGRLHLNLMAQKLKRSADFSCLLSVLVLKQLSCGLLTHLF